MEWPGKHWLATNWLKGWAIWRQLLLTAKGRIVSPVSPCSTIRGREVQPLAAPHPIVRLSPWRQVRKNIHSRVWTPGPTWSVLHPGGPPLLVPLSSCTGGYGPHPWRLIRTPVQGGYPRYHSILSPPRRASLLVPLPLDLSTSLPPEICKLVCLEWDEKCSIMSHSWDCVVRLNFRVKLRLKNKLRGWNMLPRQLTL